MSYSHLFQTLENGPDGKPGGILITSVAEQIIDFVWLGGFKALSTPSFLEKNKIKHILTLGHFDPIEPPEAFNHKIIRITDNPETHIIQYFPEAIEFITKAVAKKEAVLVHCLAGVSRSPTMVVAYLMSKERKRYKEVLAQVKGVRPFVNPNPGFLEQLKLFQDMGYAFDKNHPAYLEYIKKHPVDAAHVGHEDE
ncbi:protein-tyrosine phosphatase-like protein [Sporodiniella umbellata]|nr:protein-tyrosine phosphatase-like protein [Sporodiniella umbellata]